MNNVKIFLFLLVIVASQTYYMYLQKKEYYYKGYKDGGMWAISEMKLAIRHANDSCDVVDLPVVDRDTVVYFLSSTFCELDTALNDRWVRKN